MNEIEPNGAEKQGQGLPPEARSRTHPPETTAKLPGVAAIALWMLMEALIGVMGVFTNHFASHATRLSVLAIATLLTLAGYGLLRMQRWGWALALAAAFLTSSYGVYVILRSHQQDYWVMTIVNFIFFFYLVRPEILRRLR